MPLRRLRPLRSVKLASLLLLCVPLTAAAGAGGAGDIATAFPLRETAERHGDRATMVVQFTYRRMKTGYVTNKESPKAFYFNSSKATVEFDCKRKKSRVIGTVFFSDRAGMGNIVHQQNAAGAWADEHDRRPEESHFAMACNAGGAKKP